MSHLFFGAALQHADRRIKGHTAGARLLLDKNEQAADVEMLVKKQILEHLEQSNWNRYPSADCRDIEALVAGYCGLQADNIVLGPGSASIITTLLNYFALNRRQIVIAQPAYSLFDYHCKTYGIDYTPWMLTPALQYDGRQLPELHKGALLVITTPNNPVGNTLEPGLLEQILRENPEVMVLVDAVYAEFDTADLTRLVEQYEHLMVLRSFSKAFPVAGVRLGYLCAAAQMAASVRKLMLPFALNHFTLAFAREMLFSAAFMAASRRRVTEIVREHERMYHLIRKHWSENEVRVFPSAGNFLLIRVPGEQAFLHTMQYLEKAGVKVLNTSNFPLMEHTFRVSIGTPGENDSFLNCLANSMAARG
jgi:histidinol-phosphate aminotransferase